jgi:UDP-N-acetylmuramate dehydrogenase
MNNFLRRFQMKRFNNLVEKLREIIAEENIELEAEMKNYTSFRVGGPADVLVTPTSKKEVSDIIKLCKNEKIPFYIIGNGSNIIVKDGGIRGLVIKLSKLKKITIEEDKLIGEAGATLSSASIAAREACLTGLEFACGIPGSIGGALAMNAGAYDGEMSFIVDSAVVLDINGNILNLNKEQLELEYRNSIVLKKGYIALEVTFDLKHGDCEKIRNRMNELTKRRTEKQPLEYPSAGSTFKRPEGHYASKLIQDSELKGVSVGGAEVSVKHSGFIINKDNATAQDILDLIGLVQKTVKTKFDVDLYPEVRIIGEDKK